MELLLSRTHSHGKNNSAQASFDTDHFEKGNCLVVCGGKGALRDEAKNGCWADQTTSRAPWVASYPNEDITHIIIIIIIFIEGAQLAKAVFSGALNLTN